MFIEPHIPAKRLKEEHHSGWFEMIVGPMFSGKTEELIRRIRRGEIAGLGVIIFKPRLDDRYHPEKVVSHNETSFHSISIEEVDQIMDREMVEEIFGFDEVQFFKGNLIPLIRNLTRNGKRVIAAGLDKDYLGQPFGQVPDLMAEADYLTKLNAICMVCGSPASFTYRTARNDEKILVGSKDSYEARCRKCFFEGEGDKIN